MDGTLVDTEPYWINAEHAIVEEAGGVWSDEYAHQLVGNDLMVSAQFIRDNSPVELDPVEIIEELLRRVSWRRCASTCRGVPAPSSCSPRCRRPAYRARW